MDTEIDEPTEARPLFYLFFFFSHFFPNGVKGRVPTFPRVIDRYLHNAGVSLVHQVDSTGTLHIYAYLAFLVCAIKKITRY